MKTLYVTYCCRDKKMEKGNPKEMYLSSRVKSFFNRFPGPRGILSYKYGIMFENFDYEPYDQDTFTDVDRLAFSAWVQLMAYSKLVFYSPRKLTEKLWLEFLDKIGIPYEVVRSYKEVKE